MRVYMCVRVCANACVRMCVYVFVCAYVCMCLCVRVCVCLCARACACVCVSSLSKQSVGDLPAFHLKCTGSWRHISRSMTRVLFNMVSKARLLSL